MSRADEPPRSREHGTGSSPYEVGYGKPPKEHKFIKGRSGNPRGRPKRTTAAEQNGLGVGAQPANRYLLEEAYRPVTVRQGEERIQLPAIQAVFRAMGVEALKGNRFAQRMLTELVQSVERESRQERDEHFRDSREVQIWIANGEITEAQERGLSVPEPIPHPDDIIVDLLIGRATINGPTTKEDKAEWDRLLDRRNATARGRLDARQPPPPNSLIEGKEEQLSGNVDCVAEEHTMKSTTIFRSAIEGT